MSQGGREGLDLIEVFLPAVALHGSLELHQLVEAFQYCPPVLLNKTRSACFCTS